MVKVECDGCKAPYQVDEKRIPPSGLKMRCPKCGTNLLVKRPGDAEGGAGAPGADADLPAIAAPPAPRAPGAPPPAPRAAPPRPPPKPAPKPPSPPAKVPPPRAAPPVALDEDPGFDLASDADLPAVRSGFGEIDLAVDLPAPAADLPAARPAGAPPLVRKPAPPIPKTKPAAIALPPPDDDEADLPALPMAELDDLPVAADSAEHADLPAVAGPSGHADLPAARDSDLPLLAGRGAPPGGPQRTRSPTVNFGDIDLPMAPLADLPATPAKPRARTVNFGDIDLPALPEEAELPEPAARGFGEIDLPLVGADLPASASVGLPAPAGVGLPAPAGVGLPAPAGVGLPAPAGVGLPAPAPAAGLPTPAQGAGLPTHAQAAGFPTAVSGGGLPMPAQGQGLPVAAYGGGLPMPAQGQGLPVAAYGGGLPMPAQGQGLPMPAQTGLPAPVDVGFPDAFTMGETPKPPPQAFGEGPAAGRAPAFGDIAFGDEIPLDAGPPGRSNAFDDSDRAVPGAMDATAAPTGPVGIDVDADPLRAKVGDEADLAAPLAAPLESAQVAAPRRSREPEAPAKKSNAGRAALVAAVLLTLTGGALTMSPAIGPFGAHIISDQINAGKYAASLDALRKATGTLLDEDTYASVSTAIDRCKAAGLEMPRHRPTAGYCAELTLQRGLRFGHSADDEASAQQLLTVAADGGGDDAALAKTALDVLGGRGAQARGQVAAIAQRAPGNVDVAVVAAYVELADKAAVKAAVTAWQHAVSMKKSARTLYGLARAEEAAGDAAGAEASARAALAASSAHAGARTLLASLIGYDTAREKDAIKLLKEVTAGEPGKAASEGELVDAFTELGMIHLARSRMTAAAEAFAAALKRAPLAVRPLIGSGELLYRSGRYSEALARFDAATKAEPDNVVAKVGTAKTWLKLEKTKDALDLLKKLRAEKPKDALVALWLGHIEESLGKRKDATAAYTDAIKLGGDKAEAVDAYVALAHLLSGGGQSDEANAKLAEASQKFPDLPALHRARGEVALQMGRYEEAERELRAALAKEDDLGTLFRLGVTLRRMRRFDDAKAVLEKVSAVDKDFPGLTLEWGLLFEDSGQRDKALAAYRAALEKAPNDVDLKLHVGSNQVMAGHPEEALKLLREVKNERPNSAEANHFLGRALLLTNQNPQEALRYLEAAVGIDANRPEYYLYVGWAANEVNEQGKAAAALNKAIELDHDLGDAYWQRGVLRQKQGATVDALADLHTALEKRPSRFEAWATIAVCDQDLSKWTEAEEAWRRAIAGNDQVAEWHYRLGKLLAGHGKKAASLPELEQAVTLGDKPGDLVRPWVIDAHYLLADGLRPSPAFKEKAIKHYKRFLELAPKDNAYVPDAKAALAALGVRDTE